MNSHLGSFPPFRSSRCSRRLNKGQIFDTSDGSGVRVRVQEVTVAARWSIGNRNGRSRNIMEKMARPVPLNPTFLPPTHGVLKSLLENPLKLPFHHDEGFGKDKEKEKKLDDEGSTANHPQSAFLGPTLWDKTLPYDEDNFQLEYMDLEEFLSENGIPANSAQSDQAQQQQQAVQQQPPQAAAAAAAPPTLSTPSVVDLSSRATTSALAGGMAPQSCRRSPSAAALPSSRDTPSPIDPESIQVPVTYDPDPADLALSSVPGQEMFDPRKRKFSAEELKPQPMIKKARKVFIPEDLKDDRYWARRRKNNVAAKRSRDARRLKENQIAIRAGFLERENAALRSEVADLRKELGRCKNVVAKYEARHGPL
ncbi:putative hepatic leukemia factor-like [Scophthalmus maximus]|uniref:Putative hepatic leukemia factor-like n=1 Tax=Scophthalmus maximus TaxID=52904 RepID=A0A2U9CTG3_SCOMX|nr:putative hepatic leukemia factor-like [Scophthalmus maximus]